MAEQVVLQQVVLLSADLLFGSKVEAMIREAECEPSVTASPETALTAAAQSALLIVDLTADGFDGTAVVAAGSTPTLGFYAHTDDETRQKALANGFGKVVPRSRMMREGAELIAAMVKGSGRLPN